MRQKLTINNSYNNDGNPTGGTVEGKGISIRWQDGPIRVSHPSDDSPEGVNGAFVEGVIQAAITRMRFFQDSKFSCRENAIAITKLEEALHWLDARASRRMEEGILGKHQVSKSPV